LRAEEIVVAMVLPSRMLCVSMEFGQIADEGIIGIEIGVSPDFHCRRDEEAR